MSSSLRRLSLAALVVALAAAPGAAATPAAVTLTGDDGNPVPLTDGLTVRNMAPTIGITEPAGGENYLVSVTGPDGGSASSVAFCRGSGAVPVDYRGSGAYTVTIRVFGAKDFACSMPVVATSTWSFTIAATVTLSGPSGVVPQRAVGSVTRNSAAIAADLNPNAARTEIRYAIGAKLGADGGIVGASQDAFFDSSIGRVPIWLREPGEYTVVARQGGLASGGQTFYTAWSDPVRFTVKAPFDLLVKPFWLDSRGPSYKIRLRLADGYARGGRVAFAVAFGRRGKYRSVGSARIGKDGVIVKRLRLTKPGAYRMRVVYKGGPLVSPGRVAFSFRIRRHLI